MVESALYSIAGAIFLSAIAVAVFAWAVRDGQFEDLDRAAMLPFDDATDAATQNENSGTHPTS